jgi:uncharacterized protein
MKIGIISDSHNNTKNLETAYNFFKKNKINHVIHCGDVTDSKMLDVMNKFNITTHLVLGNMDNPDIIDDSSEYEKIIHHGITMQEMFEDKQIAACHTPHTSAELFMLNKFDVIFYGHTHKKRIENTKQTLIVCPGEILGRIGQPSLALYDTSTNKIEIHEFN